MPDYRQLLTARLTSAFAKASLTPPDGVAIEVTNASDTRFGDYQSNVAMTVASVGP